MTSSVQPNAETEIPRLRQEVLDHLAASSEPQSVASIAEALDQDLLSGIYHHLGVLCEEGKAVVVAQGYSYLYSRGEN